jgi:uncharacterized protein (DUF1778 family)
MKHVVNERGIQRDLTKEKCSVINIRIKARERLMVTMAADRLGESVSEFLRRSAQLRALKVLGAGQDQIHEN